jgi:lantibiotic modifying enzyme
MSRQLESTFDMVEEPTVLESAHRNAFVETAASLGAKVCRDALWAKDRCNWIGPAMEPLGGRWRQVHKVFGPELYGGTAGVALSLATLQRASGDRVFRRTALGALRHALARAEDVEPQSRLGLYSGRLGISLSALRVAELLDEDSLREPAVRLVNSLTSGEVEMDNEDLLAGCAGAIVALLLLRGQYVEDDSLVAFASRLGDHLISVAVKAESGWSWGRLHEPGSGAFGNLTGYSHGAGGIGSALLELYSATGEARFRDAGEQAFRYERHWFDPAKGNWPDLRDPELSGASREQGVSYMNAWCHGAPGIALSRLRVYEMLGDEVCRSEAETAIETTTANLYGNSEMSQTNYSLCHGLGGNSEPLLYGAQVLGRADLFARAEEVALRGIESYEAQRLPWPCGGPGGLETAGLMLGLAGISYYYLRMADPEETPSLLIFLPRSPARSRKNVVEPAQRARRRTPPYKHEEGG